MENENENNVAALSQPIRVGFDHKIVVHMHLPVFCFAFFFIS